MGETDSFRAVHGGRWSPANLPSRTVATAIISVIREEWPPSSAPTPPTVVFLCCCFFTWQLDASLSLCPSLFFNLKPQTVASTFYMSGILFCKPTCFSSLKSSPSCEVRAILFVFQMRTCRLRESHGRCKPRVDSQANKHGALCAGPGVLGSSGPGTPSSAGNWDSRAGPLLRPFPFPTVRP